MATINDLSDAILCEIFSYFDLVKRQRLEIVCKRWQALIRVLWSKITKLSFEIRYEEDSFLLWVQNSFSYGFDIVTDKPSDIGALFKICENNLTELVITNKGPDADDTDAFIPLRKCKNLKRFFIETYDNNLIRDVLYNMPTESLEKLEVYNVEYEFRDEIHAIIEEILMQAQHLTSLGLSGVSSSGLGIIGMKSKLECLDLGNLNNSIETEDLSLDCTNLVNLEDLEICDERIVDGQLIFQIAENCKKLRRVKLWTEDSISDELKILGTLPNLRIVDLIVPEETEVLNCFSNLEEFYCNFDYREGINEESLTDFLKRSPNLKKYYFDHHPSHELFDEVAKKLGKNIRRESSN